MLVVTRKRYETIRIGEDIVVQIMGVDANGVRVGVSAPPELKVLRGEMAADTAAENVRALIAGFDMGELVALLERAKNNG